MNSQDPARARGWLMLIHQIPPKPDYLRVKVRRRLRRLGAIPLKNTVYLLPDEAESLEDFTWLAREIRAEGGTALICRAELLDGMTDEEVDAMADEALTSPGRVDQVEPGRCWVTREGIKVDRMASAWLIRRFIDPEARFKFVPAKGYQPLVGELRFDMFEAEYTHEGERCTFQTLQSRFGLRDRGVVAIGEIVHDIDCKDEAFGRPETAGVASLIQGIVKSNADDAARLDRGAAVFEDLYAYFRRVDQRGSQ
jgi:hypothetical protein